MEPAVAPKKSVRKGSNIRLNFGTVEEPYYIARKDGWHMPRHGILGPDSDWGRRLIGKKVGDLVELSAPEENVMTARIISAN